jgi:YD repeat-containing protein
MSDLKGWQVHGPVRALRREHAEWDSTAGAWKAPRGITIVTFRPDGQIIASQFHNPDGSIAWWSCEYDSAGHMIETQSWINDESPRRRMRYAYDAGGRLVETVEIESDGTRRQAESYRYDANGRKTKVTTLAARGALAGVSVMESVEGSEQGYSAPGAVTRTAVFDEREQPVDVSFHDASGALVLHVTLGRDGEGRLISEEVHYGGELPFGPMDDKFAKASPEDRAALVAMLSAVFTDKMSSSTTFAYDAKGRVLEQVRRMGRLSEERTTYRYDDHDNKIEEIMESRGRSAQGDEKGEVRFEEEKPRRQEYRFDYDYDPHGNWIARVASYRIDPAADFQRSNVERRTIEYY